MLTREAGPPILKSGAAAVRPASDPIVLRVLLALFTIAVIVGVASLLARW